MSWGRPPIVAAAIGRDRVVVGISGGEVGTGVGLLLGVAATLLAIPLYKRAMAAIWEHQHAQAQAAIDANKAALKHLVAQATHAKTQADRYRRKG